MFLFYQTQSDPCVCLSMNMRFQAARNAGYLGGDTRSRRVVRHSGTVPNQIHICRSLIAHDDGVPSALKEQLCISSPPVHSPDTLKEAPVPIISTKKCNSSCMYDGEITSRMLCAGYTEGKVDACQVRCMFCLCRGVSKIHFLICDLLTGKNTTA